MNMDLLIGVIIGIVCTLSILYVIHWTKKTNAMIEGIQEDSINKTARINQLETELNKYKTIFDNK